MCTFNKLVTIFVFMLVVPIGYACNPISCTVKQNKLCIFVSQQLDINNIKTKLGEKYSVGDIQESCQKNNESDYINCIKTATKETIHHCQKEFYLGSFKEDIYILILPNKEKPMTTSLDNIIRELKKTN